MHRPNINQRIQETTDPLRKADLVKLQERIDATKVHLIELMSLKVKLLDDVEAKATTQRAIDSLLNAIRTRDEEGKVQPVDPDTADAVASLCRRAHEHHGAKELTFVPDGDLSQESVGDADLNQALEQEHAAIVLHENRIANIHNLMEQRRLARRAEMERRKRQRRQSAVCWTPEDEGVATAAHAGDERDQT